ncbi:PLP-dependent aminotransferase family protein [Oxalobacteraceae bacterium]|nr:PLP-dependent aminotransferase family protein [Oxalobacteraceae bacterium]
MTRGKSAAGLDLPQPPGLLDPRHSASKQEIVYEALRHAILKKWLPAASALPSSRTLAARWGISRGTVEAALDRLQAEAYVARRSGSGTRVCAVVPERYLMAGAAAGMPAPTPGPAGPEQAPAASEVRVLAGQPFVGRLADVNLFPMATWARYLARAIGPATPEQLCSPDAQGAQQLREQIADYLRKHRGMQCAPADIIVTTGIRHSLDLLARALLRPDDIACVEDPGYPSARRLFELAGARVAHIPVDAQGIDCAALRRQGAARLAFVTPAHQSPLGMTMSVTRRLELLDWADRHASWIIEDDYDSEFNYHSAPLPALKSLDQHGRVVYCGSFNKTLFAGLRLGFIVAPPAIRPLLAELLQATCRSVAIAPQLALAEFIRDGAYLRHLRVARRCYQQRRDTLLALLGASGRAPASGYHAGFHFVLWLPQGCDELVFCARAAACDIALQPLRAFSSAARLPPAVVIGYTALTLAQIRYAGQKLVLLLERAWDDMQAQAEAEAAPPAGTAR